MIHYHMTSFDFVSPTSWITSASASDKQNVLEERGGQSCRRGHAITARIGPHAAKLDARTRRRIRRLVYSFASTITRLIQGVTNPRDSLLHDIRTHGFTFGSICWFKFGCVFCPCIQTSGRGRSCQIKKAESLPQRKLSAPAPGEDLEKKSKNQKSIQPFPMDAESAAGAKAAASSE